MAAALGQPEDAIGLDRDAIASALQTREHELTALASVDAGGRTFYEALAELIRLARPLVVERWGPRDGTELHNRAVANQTFRTTAEALAEGGKQQQADTYARAAADASWARFRLAARCSKVHEIPARDLSAFAPSDAPPLPVLALDLSVGGRLVRVGRRGEVTPLGAEGLRLHSPALSPDGSQIAAESVTAPSEKQQIRILGVNGDVRAAMGPVWNCGGWLADGTLVLGAVAGDTMRYQAQAERSLNLKGGSCPTPGLAPDEVLLTAGVVEREFPWISAQRHVDGTEIRRYGLRHCTVTSPAASRDKGKVAFAATCDDRKWLSFLVVPVDGASSYDARLGFAHSDGAAAFRLSDGRLSFPMWPQAT